MKRGAAAAIGQETRKESRGNQGDGERDTDRERGRLPAAMSVKRGEDSERERKFKLGENNF